jgi:hypothetical protein
MHIVIFTNRFDLKISKYAGDIDHYLVSMEGIPKSYVARKVKNKVIMKSHYLYITWKWNRRKKYFVA